MTSDLETRVRELLDGPLRAAGFDLEELRVTRAGKHSLVRVAVDRDGGVDLDATAEAARVIDPVLDEHERIFPAQYTLEVTSPGVDRPLTMARHWRRNTGRLVLLTRADGSRVTGRVARAGEEDVTLDIDGTETLERYADVTRAVVQVEFSRPTTESTEAEEDGS